MQRDMIWKNRSGYHTHAWIAAEAAEIASMVSTCDIDVAPGCILCGEVTLGADSHIGAGATILQGVTVGAGVLVGAGAVVTKDIRNNASVKGIPAREGD